MNSQASQGGISFGAMSVVANNQNPQDQRIQQSQFSMNGDAYPNGVPVRNQ